MNVSLIQQVRQKATQGQQRPASRPLLLGPGQAQPQARPAAAKIQGPGAFAPGNGSLEARLSAVERQLSNLTKVLSDAAKTVNANDDELQKSKRIVRGLAAFLKQTAETVDSITAYLQQDDGGDPAPAQTEPSAPGDNPFGLSAEDAAMFTQGDSEEPGA